MSKWLREARRVAAGWGDCRTAAALGCDLSCQLPPLTHPLPRLHCVCSVKSARYYKSEDGKAWLTHHERLSPVPLRSGSNAQHRTWLTEAAAWGGSMQGRDPMTHALHTPTSWPCVKSFNILLSPAWPVHRGIPCVNPFPRGTGEKATMVFWHWAPQRAIAGRAMLVLPSVREGTVRKPLPRWQPYLSHTEISGTRQQLHPAPCWCEECLVGCLSAALEPATPGSGLR